MCDQKQVEHLAATLDKSPAEVARALQNLADKGLIEVAPASAALVSPDER